MFTFQNPHPQQLTLLYPTTLIKYIIHNPSSGKAWQKLIKTCKLFYSKNPLYPICSLSTTSVSSIWDTDEGLLDMEKVFPKLWLYNSFEISNAHIIFNKFFKISKFMLNFNKIDFRHLLIHNQHLFWDDFQILTSSASLSSLTFYDSVIVYSDKTHATCDEFIKCISKLEILDICFDRFSFFKNDTVKNIVNIFLDSKNLHKINFSGLTENFDIASFKNFIMTNENVEIYLRYGGKIFDAYRSILETLIDEIIKNPPKKIPHISFPGFEGDRFYKYYNLHLPMNVNDC